MPNNPSLAQSILSIFSKKVAAYIPATEEYDVSNFLNNSNELKQMKSIYAKTRVATQLKEMKEVIDKINTAKKFGEVLSALDGLNLEKPNEAPIERKLTRFAVNSFYFLGGYIRNDCNFGYYALHLRENVVNQMNQLACKKEALV